MAEMKDLVIADAHAHIFPGKIAEKAVGAIGAFYSIPMQHPGSPEALLESGRAIGVRKYLVCSTATRPGQVVSINDFIRESCAVHPEFVGFGTLHPSFPDIPGEIRRIREMGLRGVKLHPDFQRFAIDDPAAFPIYECCQELGLPILFHTGDARYDWSAPARMEAVAKRYPGLTCIAAHFGGYSHWQDVERYRDLPNVWFDTSSSLFCLPRERALALIRLLGHRRFLFGTDFPMWDHREELERFLALGLPAEARDAILYRNFQRVFEVAV